MWEEDETIKQEHREACSCTPLFLSDFSEVQTASQHAWEQDLHHTPVTRKGNEAFFL